MIGTDELRTVLECIEKALRMQIESHPQPNFVQFNFLGTNTNTTADNFRK